MNNERREIKRILCMYKSMNQLLTSNLNLHEVGETKTKDIWGNVFSKFQHTKL
jgi:hypothetical protein